MKTKRATHKIILFSLRFGPLDRPLNTIRSRLRGIGLHAFCFFCFVVIGCDVLPPTFVRRRALRVRKCRRNDARTANNIERKKKIYPGVLGASMFATRSEVQRDVFGDLRNDAIAEGRPKLHEHVTLTRFVKHKGAQIKCDAKWSPK